MKQSTKKTIKKLAWLTPAVVSIGVSAVNMFQLGVNLEKEIALAKESDGLYKQVIDSIEFKKYYAERKQALYDAYKNGIISASEYGAKVDALSAYDNVWNNREYYMSEQQEEAINTITEQTNQVIDETARNAMFTFGGLGATTLLGIGYALTKENEDQSTQSSIMSQCSYSDLLEDNEM